MNRSIFIGSYTFRSSADTDQKSLAGSDAIANEKIHENSTLRGVGLSGIREKVPPAGLEPATVRLEIACSIQLSYEGKTDNDANI